MKGMSAYGRLELKSVSDAFSSSNFSIWGYLSIIKINQWLKPHLLSFHSRCNKVVSLQVQAGELQGNETL